MELMHERKHIQSEHQEEWFEQAYDVELMN